MFPKSVGKPLCESDRVPAYASGWVSAGVYACSPPWNNFCLCAAAPSAKLPAHLNAWLQDIRHGGRQARASSPARLWRCDSLRALLSQTAFLFQSSAVSPVTDFCIWQNRKGNCVCLSLENSRCDVSNTVSSKMTYPFPGDIITDLPSLEMEPATTLLLMEKKKKKSFIDSTVRKCAKSIDGFTVVLL